MPLWAKKGEKKVTRRSTKKVDSASTSNTPKIRYILVGLGMSAVIVGAVWWVMTTPLMEIKQVSIKSKNGETELAFVSDEELNKVVKRAAKGSLLTLNMPSIQSAFEELPWVRSASLRRILPHTLEVQLEEHQPLARWGSGGLVNTFGEHFIADYDEKLPALSGPEGSEAEVAQEYALYIDALKPIGRKPIQVSLSARRAWQIRLDDGAVIELGRNDMQKRLARYVSVYSKTAGQPGIFAKYADLRYPNGIAMRIAASSTINESVTGTKQ
ncbi:MAG: cell division protein FtsQ [Pseudomonadota bacterium]|jgi:cell division protein FtsQ